MTKNEQILNLKCQKQEFDNFLKHSARRFRSKSQQRSTDYLNQLNETVHILNHTPSILLSDIPSHKFYLILRNLVRDFFNDWYSSKKNFHEEEISFLRYTIRFFNRLIRIINDVTKLTSWLIEPSFIKSISNCLTDIDRLLYYNRNRRLFKQLIRLFDVFNNYYKKLPGDFQNHHELDQLFQSTMDCLVSSNYDQLFRKLKTNSEIMTREENFFLIKCPSFISSYRGLKSSKIIEQILGTMIPRYAFILDQHLRTIQQWNSSIIHAIHHLLLTIIFAKGYYSPYANGQPLQWFIDHIICMISQETFINKIKEKRQNSETILIDSCLRTLTAFVHEPDLLIYLKQLKLTSIFRSLVFVSNESIVIHAYVMLSYTLEEDDIKASEKESGRLLSNILDVLRKKIKSLSIDNKHEDLIEQDISLLVEALQALVQHDQIKSEIIKQNALSLLIEGYQHFNNRSKRSLLESLGSMTFDHEAARLLRQNTAFMQSIQDMQTTTTDVGINKAAEKIMWNLVNEPEREHKTTKKQTEATDTNEDKSEKDEYQYDIMISYCHADKETVYRIHQFLIDKGFKVWVDRDNIYGPAMQAMADAVENSEFVILCMSDSYKRSVYCQAEAEYAFRCKRNLLPIIVRQGYRPDGWLGLVIGSRIYVDFGRLEFKKACDLILKEISLQRENKLNEKKNEKSLNRKKSVTEISTNIKDSVIETIEKSKFPKEYLNRNTIKSNYRHISIEKWTRNDVLDFLYDKNLHYMMPLCELMTGLGLVKLFRICQTKPNRFYQQLNEEFQTRFENLHLPIGIFTQFLSEIDRLISRSSVHDIEQDALQSKSNSPSTTTTSSPTKIIKRTSSPTSLIIPSRKSSSPPAITTIRTSTNVKITEQTAYRTEPLIHPINNNNNHHIVQSSSQDAAIVHSEVRIVNDPSHQNQRTAYMYGAKAVQKTIFT